MRPDEVIKRLQAWHKGRPLPAYKTRHFAIAKADDLLIVAFVRMGGESAPWESPGAILARNLNSLQCRKQETGTP